MSVRLNDGDGNFSGTTAIAVEGLNLSVALGDLHLDGDLDLVAANQLKNTVSIRFNDGAGNFSGSRTVAVGKQPYTVALGEPQWSGYCNGLRIAEPWLARAESG